MLIHALPLALLASAVPFASTVFDRSRCGADPVHAALPVVETEHLIGWFNVTNPDGTPPVAGVDVQIVMVYLPWPLDFLGGYLYANGRQIPGETFHAYANDDGTYSWENFRPGDRKATGIIRPLDDGGFESTVLTGPNRGTVRHMVR